MTRNNSIPSWYTAWCVSAWQLIWLTLPTAYQQWIEIILLAEGLDNPAPRVINPSTWTPFVQEDNIIVVPKWENKQPDWNNTKSLDKFMKRVGTWNPISLEFENIPWTAVEYLEKNGFEVFPNSNVLKTIQDRLTEKEAINNWWLETVPYDVVDSEKDIRTFISQHGWISKGFVIKSRKGGYDGHGQAVIKSEDDIEKALILLDASQQHGGVIIEQMIDLESEVSIVAARQADGSIKVLDTIFNIHNNWILNTSILATPEFQESLIWWDIVQKLKEDTIAFLSNWDEYRWIITIEFFISKARKTYVNELAPRTHNSGHATIDSWGTSQNELWMNTISWKTTQIVEATQNVVMKNILTPQALQLYRWWYAGNSFKKFYDYQKLWDDISEIDDQIRKYPFSIPDWVKSRKVWHVNFTWATVDKLLWKLKAWTIWKAEFLRDVWRLR